MSTVKRQLGGDLLNVHGQAATRGDLYRQQLGGDLLNVHGETGNIGGYSLKVHSKVDKM